MCTYRPHILIYPLLVTDEQDERVTRRPNQVLFEVLIELIELLQGVDEPVHDGALLCGLSTARGEFRFPSQRRRPRTRASREHPDDQERGHAPDQPIDQSVEPACIAWQIQRRDKNGRDGSLTGPHFPC